MQVGPAPHPLSPDVPGHQSVSWGVARRSKSPRICDGAEDQGSNVGMKPANDRAVSVAQIAFGTATGTRAARRRSFTVWRADSRGAVVRRVSRSRTDVQY